MGRGPDLERMLRNEADMAAKRRVRTVLEYLDIRPGERVFDCGCGLGWFLKIIGELHDCALVGGDSDLPRLSRARAELGPRAGLSASDILRLPFRDGCFDKIVLSEVLEHLPDDRAGLLEAKRVLKKGGVMAITVPNHDYPFLWDPINWSRERLGLDPIREGTLGGLWTNHVRLYFRDEIVALVRGADLVIEDVRQHVHHCFPFAHNLVYGLGMRLVESGVLPEADRFRYDTDGEAPLHPVALGRAVFNAIDSLNDPTSDEGKTAVILSVKARKPAA